jgi:hypothetical protein
MKRLWLVGESLPKKEGTPSGSHAKELAAIDARHGVFPNLVGKPLLSALHWLHSQALPTDGLLDQLDLLMTDASRDRRFNIFQKKASQEDFRLHDDIPKRLECFEPQQHLWLVFGSQTNFGLVGFLLGIFRSTESYAKKDIQSLAIDFIDLALSYKPLPPGLPSKTPTQQTARLGVLHRLCCHACRAGADCEGALRQAVTEFPPLQGRSATERDVDVIVAKLRSIVPLLHKEAYQDRYEIGYNQANFVLASSVKKWKDKAPDMYWSVMGEAIGRRLQGHFVKAPVNLVDD